MFVRRWSGGGEERRCFSLCAKDELEEVGEHPVAVKAGNGEDVEDEEEEVDACEEDESLLGFWL